MPVVGVLSVGSATSSLGAQAGNAFAQGLRELGVDVIVARATPSIRAAKQATATIPIVMSAAGHDPVHLGFVASLAKPGANITGLTLLNQDPPAKQLQLLREVVPGLSRAAVLGSRAFPLPPKGRQDVEAAAAALGLQLQHLDLAGADDLDRTFADMTRARIGGVLVRSDPFVLEPKPSESSPLPSRIGFLPSIGWMPTRKRAASSPTAPI